MARTANLNLEFAKKLPFVLQSETWLISISNCADVAIVPDPVFSKVFFFQFDDWDKAFEPSCGLQRMKASQGIEIVQIVREAQLAGVDLFVNCHAGICRSGAIAQALVDFADFKLLESEMLEEIVPNRFIYNSLRRLFGFNHSVEIE